jgi:cytochrome P450
MDKHTEAKLPPGPVLSPFLQNLQRIFYPTRFLDYCAHRYGDPFSVKGDRLPAIFFSHPDALHRLFTSDPDQYGAIGSRTMRPLQGAYSIGELSGELHQQLRRFLSPSFHGKALQEHGNLIRETAEQIIAHWSVGKQIAIYKDMKEISLRIILHVVFGMQRGETFEELVQLLTVLMDDTLDTPSKVLRFRLFRKQIGPWHPQARILNLVKRIDQLLYREIEERKKFLDGEKNDTLTHLLRARDANGQPLADVIIRDQLMTLAFAGREPTAASLVWALYWSASLPEVSEKLRQEFCTTGPHPEHQTIAQLPYLTAFCQETLRLYPANIVGLTRIVKEPVEIGGFTLETGMSLLPCIYLAHMRQETYPDPLRFHPERFLEQRFTAYEYAPFGGGIRRCIAANFVPFEMKLVLFTILSRFQLALPRRQRRPVKLISHGPTLGPPYHIQMVVADQHLTDAERSA